MRLVTALLVKDEADKYLRRVLARCLEFSDAVLVLDDHSTDASPQVALALGCQVRTRGESPAAWGHESSARQELWEWAAAEAKDGWVLICDADQILHGDPRPLTQSWEVNSWAFPLFDLWTEDEKYFRQDGFWQAHLVPRPWLFCPSRTPDGWRPEWSGRGIHVGHCPSNFPLACAVAPEDIFWNHLAYCSRSDRERKAERYETVANQLSEPERQHARSILDECPLISA